MENSEIKSLLEVIEQQVSSSILGGMEEKYDELEALGFVVIHRETSQWSASLTPEGEVFLEHYNK